MKQPLSRVICRNGPLDVAEVCHYLQQKTSFLGTLQSFRIFGLPLCSTENFFFLWRFYVEYLKCHNIKQKKLREDIFSIWSWTKFNLFMSSLWSIVCEKCSSACVFSILCQFFWNSTFKCISSHILAFQVCSKILLCSNIRMHDTIKCCDTSTYTSKGKRWHWDNVAT